MKVHLKINHLPTQTEWVTKSIPATQENLDKLTEFCEHFARGDIEQSCFDISEHEQTYINEKILSECTFTTAILEDVMYVTDSI
jgi:hypothetical protein